MRGCPSRLSLYVEGTLGGVTLIAQLDTTKSPALVIAMYTYLDSSYMVAPAYMDVTTVTPPIQNGCTYDTTKKVWAYPAHPEDMVAAVKAAIATNNAYLASNQNAALQKTQIAALSTQINRLWIRRIGGQLGDALAAPGRQDAKRASDRRQALPGAVEVDLVGARRVIVGGAHHAAGDGVMRVNERDTVAGADHPRRPRHAGRVGHIPDQGRLPGGGPFLLEDQERLPDLDRPFRQPSARVGGADADLDRRRDPCQSGGGRGVLRV